MSDHQDHPLPPPEPDNVDAGGVTFWGLASFVSVLAVVGGLSGYFWIERENAVAQSIEQYGASAYRAEMAQEREALEKGAGKTLPIAEAMKKVAESGSAQSRAQHFPLPAPKPVAAQPAAAVAVAAPAAKPFVVDAKLAAKGKGLFTSKICATCHSIDGSRKVGPSMKGLWGRKEKLTDGTEVLVDKAYFTRSIKEPMAQIVAGYPPGMAALPVSDDEIEALMHYVVTLK